MTSEASAVLVARAARSSAERAVNAFTPGGTTSRLVREPPGPTATRRSGGISGDQERRTERPATGRRSGLFRHPVAPSSIRWTGPRRPSRARISPGSSAAGSPDLGHHPPSRTAPWRRAGFSLSLGAAEEAPEAGGGRDA